VLSGELALWYVGGGYMDVSEVVIFMIVAKCTSRTSVLDLSINRIQDSCVLTYTTPLPNSLKHNGDDAAKA